MNGFGDRLKAELLKRHE